GATFSSAATRSHSPGRGPSGACGAAYESASVGPGERKCAPAHRLGTIEDCHRAYDRFAQLGPLLSDGMSGAVLVRSGAAGQSARHERALLLLGIGAGGCS